MKRKFLWIIVVLILIVCGTILFRQYRSYKEYVERLSSPGLYQITEAIYDYKSKKGSFPHKQELQNYIKSQDKYMDLVDYFEYIKYDIADKEDTIVLYAYGFDDRDDLYRKHYDLSEVSFGRSFGIRGDIPIAVIDKNHSQKEPINPFKEDSVMPPPPDSIKH